MSAFDFLSPGLATVELQAAAGGGERAGDGVWVRDVSLALGKVDVRGEAAAFGLDAPGVSRTDGDARLCRLTPLRGLVLCPPGDVPRWAADGVDVTCAYAALRLGGERRLDLFRRISDLDVRPRAFAPDAVASAPVAGCAGIVVNEGDTLLLLAGWEYGAYLWEVAQL